MHDLLAAIVACARTSAAHRQAGRPWREVERAAQEASPNGEAFGACLRSPTHVRVIAECKWRSPARGVLRASYDPATIAAGYETAGAAAVSVLTEPAFFDGDLAHLAAVRARVSLPLLRKDFLVDAYQVVEACAAGADAVLLLAAALDGRQLRELLDLARATGLEGLVEIHDERDRERALEAGASVIGVNSRDLRDLRVDRTTFERLVDGIPADVVRVAESGLSSVAAVSHVRRLGYDACLIGEWFMRSDRPGDELAALLREAR